MSLVLFSVQISASDCKKGDKAYELMQYHKAITEYEKCLKDDKSNLKTIERLADSYRILDNYTKAAEYYQIILKEKSTSLKAKYWYASSLLASEQTELCRKFVDSMSIRHPKDADFLRLQSSLKILGEKETYNISKPTFNTAEADYAAVVWRDKVVFSSTLIGKKDLFTGQAYSSLMVYDSTNNMVSEFAPELFAKYNIGSSSFSSDGNIMYFTANSAKTNKKSTATLMIMETKRINEKWIEPIPFIHNKPEYNFAHPTLSPSGKLFVFSSDSYTTFGMDLYFCTLEKSGKWSIPKRFKTIINTPYNEVFPVFLNDSTITFSSDGHGGLGGLDIFSTTFTTGNWSDPVHLAQPFNSQGDDFSLFSSDNLHSGYFTSNRNEPSGNEDIYFFEKKNKCTIIAGLYDFHEDKMVTSLTYDIIENQKLKENLISLENGLVYHELKDGTKTEIRTIYQGKSFYGAASSDECFGDTIRIVFNYQEKVMATLGKVFEEETKIGYPNVSVYFVDTLSKEVFTVVTDSSGQFKIDLPINRFYHYKAKIHGSLEETGVIGTKYKTTNPEIEISFKKPKVNQVFVLKNILYDYDKWNIRPDAAIELDRLIAFLNENPSIRIELSSHTDARGNDRYNEKLSEKRAASAVAYLVEKGIAKNRLISKGYGEYKLINECKNGVVCDEDLHLQNRRTEVKILEVDN
ncbi:MAG TPA: OmpA family protein [Saprospiraceae bacterium]|nr:OmpA family protein [Saprospiraceae bacterium]